MRVNIAVVGRFHAFNLANELQNKDLLNKLITTYPKSIVFKWNIKKELVKDEIFLELIRRYKNKVPFISNTYLETFIQKNHAKKSARYLNECDIFIGWSGSSLESLIEAKKQNKITLLERGSSHYNYQMKILQETNKNFLPNYNSWQRELLEYELADYISIPSSFVKRTFIENGIPENKLIVNIYGTGWEKKPYKHQINNLFIHKHPLFNENYALAIASSKITLTFLSKINEDLHTSRSFEIPACGGFMIAERTSEHTTLFEENKEAVYFSSNNELLEKINYYLNNEIVRKEIINNALKRSKSSGYSYDDMADKLVIDFQELYV